MSEATQAITAAQAAADALAAALAAAPAATEAVTAANPPPKPLPSHKIQQRLQRNIITYMIRSRRKKPSRRIDCHLPLPSSPAEWNLHAAPMNVGESFDFGKFQSGSKITYEQFLHMRAIWIEHQGHEFFKNSTALRMVRRHQLRVQRCPDRQNFELTVSPMKIRRFMERLRKEQPDTPSQKPRFDTDKRGPYTTPVAQQTRFISPSTSDSSLATQESARTDTPEPISPITKDTKGLFSSASDEQIVNLALVLFLDRVTMEFARSAEWVIDRQAFQAKKKRKGYGARVRWASSSHFRWKNLGHYGAETVCTVSSIHEHPIAGVCSNGGVDKQLSA